MAKGLAIASNYYNRVEAIKDFMALASWAREQGQDDLVLEYFPLQGAGHRTIDKHNRALRSALETLGLEPPPNQSAG